MFATPLITFIIWLFYSRGQYNYTEHLMANLYISGYTALAHVLIFKLLALLLQIDSTYVLIGYFIFETTYRCVFYYQFIGNKNRFNALKSIGVSLVVVLFWVFFSYGLVYFYISNGLWGLFP
jgi:hypothetical protein